MRKDASNKECEGQKGKKKRSQQQEQRDDKEAVKGGRCHDRTKAQQ